MKFTILSYPSNPNAWEYVVWIIAIIIIISGIAYLASNLHDNKYPDFYDSDIEDFKEITSLMDSDEAMDLINQNQNEKRTDKKS